MDALRARVESQEKDLRDARAELDVLRAAVHQQASVNASDAASGRPPDGAMGFGPGAFGGSTEAPDAPGPSGLRPGTQRQLGSLMILTSLLVGGLVAATTMCHRSPGSCGTRARLAPGPRAAAPMAAPTPYEPAWSPFVRFGQVVSPGAPAVVAEGTRCSVEVAPAEGGGDLDCRIVVRCDDRVLYGEDPMTGYATCGVVPSRVVDANTTDRDGDPAMTLDLASGTVTVEERVGLGVQRVEIALDPIGGTAPVEDSLSDSPSALLFFPSTP